LNIEHEKKTERSRVFSPGYFQIKTFIPLVVIM
jgi:hypothetical protein